MADCKRKTANLIDETKVTPNTYINDSGGTGFSTASNITDYIDINASPFVISGVITSSIRSESLRAVCFFDSDKIFISSVSYSPNVMTNPAIISVIPQNAKYVRFAFDKAFENGIMLNLGSTPKPYEPYWLHSLRKLTTATEAVESPLYSDGTAITSYTIKGNTVQNGTPTPDNPVDVNGVGVRTANLFNKNNGSYRAYVDDAGTWRYVDTAKSVKIPCSANTTYTLSVPENLSVFRIYELSDALAEPPTQAAEIIRGGGIDRYTFTTASTTAAIIFQGSAGIFEEWFNGLMMNTGSTPLPYETYGYKIPISSGQQTTNIYLGSTQTVRQIKKLVFDGSEGWLMHPTISNLFYIDGYDDGYYNNAEKGFAMSNAFIQREYNAVGSLSKGQFVYGVPSGGSGKRLLMKNTAYSTVEDWKTWLAQQYTNGTPVTFYYVLAAAETATVNEPLMKIGNYADTLSNATAIPTTEGANSITVDTTVQPSEFTATWTGWHDSSVKEWDGTEWQ